MADYKEFTSLNEFSMFDGTLESVKENIFMRLFNKHNLPLNKKLDTVPYVRHADLVLTISVEERTYFDNRRGMYTYLITNEDLELLNTDFKTLKEIAMKNLIDKNSARIETLTEHTFRAHIFSPLSEIPDGMNMMLDVKGKESIKRNLFEGNKYGPLPIVDTNGTNDILLISNRTQTFASVNFIIPEVLDKIYYEFGQNYYIIPISVHELICVKSSYVDNNGKKTHKQAIEDLKDMVEEINDVVHKNESDILSYNIYYHMHDDRCTMIVT